MSYLGIAAAASFLGIYAGMGLYRIAKDEVRKGGWLLHRLRAAFAMAALFFGLLMAGNVFLKFGIVLGIAAFLIFGFVPAAAYAAFILVIAALPGELAIPALLCVFCYGCISGAMMAQDKNGAERAARSTLLILFYTAIAALLPFFVSNL